MSRKATDSALRSRIMQLSRGRNVTTEWSQKVSASHFLMCHLHSPMNPQWKWSSGLPRGELVKASNSLCLQTVVSPQLRVQLHPQLINMFELYIWSIDSQQPSNLIKCFYSCQTNHYTDLSILYLGICKHKFQLWNTQQRKTFHKSAALATIKS